MGRQLPTFDPSFIGHVQDQYVDMGRHVLPCRYDRLKLHKMRILYELPTLQRAKKEYTPIN